jgi:uncharacterized protein YggE
MDSLDTLLKDVEEAQSQTSEELKAATHFLESLRVQWDDLESTRIVVANAMQALADGDY